MCKCRRFRAHRGEHLDLYCGVRNVVFAAQHLRNTHVDIVDCAGQHVEPATVSTPDHRIRQQLRIKF